MNNVSSPFTFLQKTFNQAEINRWRSDGRFARNRCCIYQENTMNHLSLPIEDPVLIFSLVLFIILLAPMIMKRLRIPGLIGLIVAGIIVGPNGLNLLLRDASIVLFGTVGLLYIMFLAGLEIDLNDFQKNRNRSLVFGAFTFLIPQTVGTLVGYYVLGFGWASSILLASMFASHTLLAYPIASRLGITGNEAITVTVGGTMITDTLALLVLAVITGSTNGELNAAFWLRLGISFAIFLVIVLLLVPRVSGWFFRYGQGDGGSQYIFILAMVFASAFLAELAGVEAIIGAFLAGLALNRLVPHTSPLMNRIEFVGNTLFIPFFLMSVGMLVDLRVLFQGTEALFVALVMIVVATGGKYVAAWATQKVFGYSRDERQVMFGLSNAQAAATLAAVLVGYNLGLLNENVLNGTILMILVTCFISSFVVESAGRRLAITESKRRPDLSEVPERILIPIAHPATIEQLLDVAIMIKNPQSSEPVFPLMVVRDDTNAREQVATNLKILDKAITHASATETAVQVVSRVDLNVATGIARAITELMITEVVIGWNGQVSARQRVLGGVLDHLLTLSRQMVLVCKLVHPLNVTRKIVILVPEYAERETGFIRWVRVVRNLSRQVGAGIEFWGAPLTLQHVTAVLDGSKPAVDASYHHFTDWDNCLSILQEVTDEDLLLVISARGSTLSHHKYHDIIPQKLAKEHQSASFILVYPEQNAIDPATGKRPQGQNLDYLTA